MRLYALGVVQRNPARAGLELAPAVTGALPGLHGGDGEDPGTGKSTGGCVVCPRPGADVQVRHGYPHLEGSIAGDAGSASPDVYTAFPSASKTEYPGFLSAHAFALARIV